MENNRKIVNLIMEDLRIKEKRALIIAQNLNTIEPELQPCVAAWKNRNFLDFNFSNVSISEIMKKEGIVYLEAIFKMNVLMKNPDLAISYKDFVFVRK